MNQAFGTQTPIAYDIAQKVTYAGDEIVYIVGVKALADQERWTSQRATPLIA